MSVETSGLKASPNLVTSYLFALLFLSCTVFVPTILPMVWLRWECRAARLASDQMAESASQHVEVALDNWFQRFDKATRTIGVAEVQGDRTALTARLLRSEQLIEPATDLRVVDAQGRQLASTSVGIDPDMGSENLSKSITPRQAADILLLCKTTPNDDNWTVAHRVSAPLDQTPGWVLATISMAGLQAVIDQGGPTAPGVDITLSTAAGCTVSRRATHAVPIEKSSPTTWIAQLLLPYGWATTSSATALERMSNVVVMATSTPDAVLNQWTKELVQNARTVASWSMIEWSVLCFLGSFILMRCWHSERASAAVSKCIELPPTLCGTNSERLIKTSADVDLLLAMVAREVQAPVCAALELSQSLLDSELDVPQRQWVKNIAANCELLQAMLGGMVGRLAITPDETRARRKTVDIVGLLDEVCELMRTQGEITGPAIIVTLEDNIRGIWQVDNIRLRQVLICLCGYAVAHLGPKNLEINARTESSADEESMLRISIIASALSIASGGSEQSLEQADSCEGLTICGKETPGLGLSLCRNIASLLGGEVEMESGRRDYCTFSLQVPIRKSSRSIDAVLAPPERTAIVIGLDPFARQNVASQLDQNGFYCETACDGFIAVGLAERMLNFRGSLNLVLIDSSLSGLSATTITTRLEALVSPNRLRTILITEAPLTLESGARADAVISKPVSGNDLERAITELFGATFDHLREGPINNDRANILLIESDRSGQRAHLTQLRAAGFLAQVASSSREGLEAIQRGGLDAVLVTVEMPKFDGIEASRLIRSIEASGQRIPIVGLTLYASISITERCIDAGMDAVLDQPLDAVALKSKLRKLKSTTCIGGSQSAMPTTDDHGGFDIAEEYLIKLIATIGLQESRKRMRAFLVNIKSGILDLARMVASRQWERLEAASSDFATSAGALGAISLNDGLLILGDAARNGDIEHATAALLDIKSTWERTRFKLGACIDVAPNCKDGFSDSNT